MSPPGISTWPVSRGWCGRLALFLAVALSVCSAWAETGELSENPFPAKAPPRGRTMFTELSPKDTGVSVQNLYEDPKMWGELYHEFDLGAIGTGMAIGDYDGDGRPDIFVVTKTGGCRLFRNLGGYKFEDVTQKAGVGGQPGVWNGGATFVDINNSGRLDIYVCRYNAPNLLYINQGDGTFREMAHSYGLDVTDASSMASFCDYDRDGYLDVFVQTNLLNYGQHPSGQRNYLFHNNGNGTFTDVTAQAGISGEGHGHSALWFNNAWGWPDLYVANDFAAPDILYHNNLDGTFTNTLNDQVPHTPFSSMGSDEGDLLNRGVTDLLLTDMAATSHEQDQRGMADSRSRTTEDDANPGVAPQYEHNTLLLATSTGHFLEAAHLAGLDSTDWTWSPRLEDFDNDGRVDLFVTNGMHREQTNVDLLARQSVSETPAERIRIMHDSPVFAQTHLAYRNLGDLRFENVGAAWGLDQKGVAFGSAVGDLGGDGNLDIVYVSYLGGVTILRNDCDSGHSVEVVLRGGKSNKFGVGATVRIESALGIQARTLFLARGYMSSSEPMLHFGLGADTVIRKMVVSWPGGSEQTFANLGVDRRFTVTEPVFHGKTVIRASDRQHPFEESAQQLGLAASTREDVVDETGTQRLLPMRFNRRGPAIAVGDVDGSGRDSVVVAGTSRDPLKLFLADASGHFQETTPLGATPFAIDDGPVLLLDTTGNGRTDLLVTRGGNALPDGAAEYQPRLYLNDGRGGFGQAPAGTLPSLSINAGAVAAADFDHSGRLGVFIGARILPGQYPLAPRSVLLANRGGRFEDVTDALAPSLRQVGMVTSAVWSDVDRDGWPDLVLALDWGHVKYFHNMQGKGFEDWSDKAGFSSAGTGWWTSVASADFNGDGRPDFVVGNLGLNTQYHASADRPAVLYYGDFRGDGEEPQIVEAYYENDRLYPWRTRRDLGGVIPSILRRFPRNNAYAHATLGEILGEEKLAAAQRLEATQFQSGVFLSKPDGTYAFSPLPRVAQISPFQGVVAGYFDTSGHAGIYAAQNSYAPIPLVGRFDGGLSQLLRGDGQGRFTAVPPDESGLVVPGDAKAVALADLGGDALPGFIVSRNNAPVLAFREHPGGRSALHVRLRGLAGNPTAVGARVTLVLSDGTSESCVVTAGSGYASQSSASCFFEFAPELKAKAIHVAWPSGQQSDFAAGGSAGQLTLAQPAP
ncbi:MAG TPA: FG-GAP-like repeat-containing protein [Opitutaceae bacterium]|nr:FG-GAP-like repeat-containing protein [Opitutaceae bacterium]